MEHTTQRPAAAANEQHRVTDTPKPRAWPLLHMLLRLQSQARAG